MLAKVSLMNWPFPSDNSEVPDFNQESTLTTYVNSRISASDIFDNVAFDGRINTSIRLSVPPGTLEKFVRWHADTELNYCMVEYYHVEGGDDPQQVLDGRRFYFIDDIDIVNAYASTALSEGQAVISLNIRADPWMNSILSLRSPSFNVRPCIVEQAHVDRWVADSDDPKIYPIKEGCDGWREYVNAKNIRTFNETKGGDAFDIYVVSWLDNNQSGDTLPNQHVAIFIPGKPLKIGSSTYTMPSETSVLDGSMSYAMGLTADSILFLGPAPYLPVKVEGDNTNGYKLTYLTFRTSLGGEQYNAGRPGLIGRTGSTVYGVDISNEIYPSDWLELAKTYLQRPTKPTWTIGGINYSEDAEPALYMGPFREDVICDGQGMPQFTLPDIMRFKNKPELTIQPAIDMGGYSTAFELGYTYLDQPLPLDIHISNRGVLGTRTVIDAPNGNIISSKWLDYSLSQRAIDLQYKKQTAFVEGVGNMASSVSTGLIAGNVAGAVGGIVSGVIGAGVTQEKYRLDRDYNDKTIRNTPNQAAIVSDGSALIRNHAYRLKIMNLKLDDISMEEAASRFKLKGYNLNILMTPNWTSRRYFNYIRTRNINLNQYIPDRYQRDQVEEIFNRGVRVWHMDRLTADRLNYTSYDFTKENIEEALVS